MWCWKYCWLTIKIKYNTYCDSMQQMCCKIIHIVKTRKRRNIFCGSSAYCCGSPMTILLWLEGKCLLWTVSTLRELSPCIFYCLPILTCTGGSLVCLCIFLSECSQLVSSWSVSTFKFCSVFAEQHKPLMSVDSKQQIIIKRGKNDISIKFIAEINRPDDHLFVFKDVFTPFVCSLVQFNQTALRTKRWLQPGKYPNSAFVPCYLAAQAVNFFLFWISCSHCQIFLTNE